MRPASTAAGAADGDEQVSLHAAWIANKPRNSSFSRRRIWSSSVRIRSMLVLQPNSPSSLVHPHHHSSLVEPPAPLEPFFARPSSLVDPHHHSSRVERPPPLLSLFLSLSERLDSISSLLTHTLPPHLWSHPPSLEPFFASPSSLVDSHNHSSLSDPEECFENFLINEWYVPLTQETVKPLVLLFLFYKEGDHPITTHSTCDGLDPRSGALRTRVMHWMWESLQQRRLKARLPSIQSTTPS